MEAYPLRDGFPIPSRELMGFLGFDMEDLSMDYMNSRSWNNHHRLFPRATMARFVMTQTLRDLETYQDPIAVQVHTELHRRYFPPELPAVAVIMERLEAAYESKELLQLGSFQNPIFQPITYESWHQINEEYTNLKR